MRLALLALQSQMEFNWEEIDIDRDPALIFKYDTLVPVLEFRGKEVCHYFIDQDAIRDIVRLRPPVTALFKRKQSNNLIFSVALTPFPVKFAGFLNRSTYYADAEYPEFFHYCPYRSR